MIQEGLNPGRERAQASLYAEGCKMHSGTHIGSHMETPNHDIGREGGRFLGVFQVTGEFSFCTPLGSVFCVKSGAARGPDPRLEVNQQLVLGPHPAPDLSKQSQLSTVHHSC